MENKKAYALIGERAAEIAKNPKVQEKMIKMMEEGASITEVETWLHRVSIATLSGLMS